MKDQALQIIQKLQAYNPDKVLEAFELYKKNLETSHEDLLEKTLKTDGWIPQSEKPDVPHYFINNQYWVLSEKARELKIEEVKQAAREKRKLQSGIKAVENGKKTKTSMSLKKSPVLCPICKSGLYQQKVCPACKDGKKGYSIRLICEDNPDHEFLI